MAASAKPAASIKMKKRRWHQYQWRHVAIIAYGICIARQRMAKIANEISEGKWRKSVSAAA